MDVQRLGLPKPVTEALLYNAYYFTEQLGGLSKEELKDKFGSRLDESQINMLYNKVQSVGNMKEKEEEDNILSDVPAPESKLVREPAEDGAVAVKDSFPCEHCDPERVFTKKSSLAQHMWQAHGIGHKGRKVKSKEEYGKGWMSGILKKKKKIETRKQKPKNGGWSTMSAKERREEMGRRRKVGLKNKTKTGLLSRAEKDRDFEEVGKQNLLETQYRKGYVVGMVSEVLSEVLNAYGEQSKDVISREELESRVLDVWLEKRNPVPSGTIKRLANGAETE